jgi:DNA-binding NarL/FixJ family response regulator
MPAPRKKMLCIEDDVETAVLLPEEFEERGNQPRGRRLGADDYVVKPIDFDILEAVVKARLSKVVRGGPWSRHVALTDRGKTSSEIAQILGLIKRNVDFHIETACRKLNVSTRIQAAVKAASGGIIEP